MNHPFLLLHRKQVLFTCTSKYSDTIPEQSIHTHKKCEVMNLGGGGGRRGGGGRGEGEEEAEVGGGEGRTGGDHTCSGYESKELFIQYPKFRIFFTYKSYIPTLFSYIHNL